MILLHWYDETNFLVECDIGTHLELKEHVSAYAANYKFHPKFKAKIWNGKISFYDIRSHLYPIGLLPQVYECAVKFGYKVKLNFDISRLSNIISDDEIDEFSYKIFKEGFELRDYQFNAIKSSLTNKRGVCLSATACLKPSSKIKCRIDSNLINVVKNMPVGYINNYIKQQEEENDKK